MFPGSNETKFWSHSLKEYMKDEKDYLTLMWKLHSCNRSVWVFVAMNICICWKNYIPVSYRIVCPNYLNQLSQFNYPNFVVLVDLKDRGNFEFGEIFYKSLHNKNEYKSKSL